MKISDLDIAKIYISKEKWVQDNPKPGVKFELSLDHFAKMARETELCEYSKLPIAPNSNLSFERKNPYLGYTDENTILVDTYANQAKGKLDSFVKTGRIAAEVKLNLLEDAADYIRSQMPKKSTAGALMASIMEIKHVVQPNKPLLLTKIYNHGSTFILKKGEDVLGKFVLVKQVGTTQIPHGRGSRTIDVEMDMLVNLETFEVLDPAITQEQATIVVLVEKK